jgi:hypothetical protein
LKAIISLTWRMTVSPVMPAKAGIHDFLPGGNAGYDGAQYVDAGLRRHDEMAGQATCP